MHLADAFIQKDLQCIQAIHFFFISMCVPWELNPQPFALLTQCSTTEPQEHSINVTQKYLVANALLSITASSLWPTDITKLLYSSFVMLFQAFTAASFSFGGLLPSVSSLAGKRHALQGLIKCGDWLGQSKTFHFLPWWTPLLFWHYVLGHYLVAWWRISQSVWLHLSVNCQPKYFCRLLS